MTAQAATTPIQSIVLVAIASFIGSFGALFLKSGAGKLHMGMRYLIFNRRLILGVALFCASSLAYVVGVRRGELSVLYPLVSLSYIWTLLWSVIFLKERLTKNKCLGLALIVAGIILIGLGKG
ncbi:MAG TPA: EamA family transporter [Bryobacteraceae bacterium]|nr:EamA family transporter [Bryobacteraceae bacterium]HOQ47450.1 EamA family transporter [Bryobacteraceae bacterium]HPU74041.1 EamA family transporter [Bryobacteraceae bacterium]